MHQLIPMHALYREILADAITPVSGALAGAELHLFQNDVVPHEGSVLEDFDVATYDGYAEEVITWGAPSVSDDGNSEVVGNAGEFRPTGELVGNVIYGAMLLNGAGALLAAVRFTDGPYPMGSTLDQITLVVRMRLATPAYVVSVS